MHTQAEPTKKSIMNNEVKETHNSEEDHLGLMGQTWGGHQTGKS